MKKSIAMIAAIGFIIFGACAANAAVYNYQPTPIDLYDLDHYSAYSWGIGWTHNNEVITGAQISFSKIYDWIVEPSDTLWLNLLSNATPGVTVFGDNSTPSNYFQNWSGTLLGTWSDPNGGGPGTDVTFTFSSAAVSALNSYAADGNFGLGLDPDCHYFNCGVKLTVTTDRQPVPEPSTMLLFGLGSTACGIVMIRRKKIARI
jgi:hypothetical protein